MAKNIMIYLNGNDKSFHCDMPVEPDVLMRNRITCGCNVFHNDPDDPADSVRCNACNSRYRTDKSMRELAKDTSHADD